MSPYEPTTVSFDRNVHQIPDSLPDGREAQSAIRYVIVYAANDHARAEDAVRWRQGIAQE